MASFYKRGKTFTVVYRLKGCRRKYIYGLKSKNVAQRARDKWTLDEQFSRAGVRGTDGDAERLAAAEQEPISKHIEEFEQNIINRGRNRQYAGTQASLARRLLESAKITSLSRIASEPIQRELKRKLGTRCGPRTCNSARQAVIQFERFLKRNGKVRETFLQNLTRFNEGLDIRRKRRPLTQEELDWLLQTTAKNLDGTSRRCGISSADRAVLYAVGIGTGFRRRALLSLQVQSVFVSAEIERPFIRLAAAMNKNHKERDQLIPHDLARRLRSWLPSRPRSGLLWQPSPHADLALRFRRDMAKARAAWIAGAPNADERDRREKSNTLKFVYRDGDRNIYADFHSLRHTGITFAVRRAGIRIGQEWADHSTPVLTARYAEVNQDDLLKAVEGLPRLSSNSLPAMTATQQEKGKVS